MSVQRDMLGTGTARQKQRLDTLLILEKMGFKSLRMKLLAGGLIHTAASITLLCLAICGSLIGVAGSNARLSDGQLYGSIILSGLIV